MSAISEETSSLLRSPLWKRKNTFLLCLCAVFAWGLLAHAYGFLHCSLSHDLLNAFLAGETEERAKISVGRFLVPLYRRFFRNAVSLPWLIGILGLGWTAIAVFLVNMLFEVRSKTVTVLIAGIMTTNISYISQIAAYHHEFDPNALSLALSVLAVVLWNAHRGLPAFLVGCLSITASLGLYQGFIAVSVTLMIGVSLRDLLEKRSAGDVFRHGLLGIAQLLLGCALYLALQKLVCAVTGVAGQPRADLLAVENPAALYAGLLKNGLYFSVSHLFHPAYGSRLLPLAALALTAALLLTTAWFFRAQKYGPARFLLALALLCAMPFAMVCIYFGARGQNVHDIMVYALWFFYVFLLLLAFRLFRLHPTRLTRTLRAAVCLLLVCLIWSNAVLANTCYIKKETEAASALSTMTRVLSDMERQEEYAYRRTPVAFVGVFDGGEHPFEYTGVRNITGVVCDTSLWGDETTPYYNTYAAYFRYVLQYPIRLCEDGQRARLASDPRVREMPAFPSRGYIQTLDGVLVVKLA